MAQDLDDRHDEDHQRTYRRPPRDPRCPCHDVTVVSRPPSVHARNKIVMRPATAWEDGGVGPPKE
jgi:hypothetical protein